MQIYILEYTKYGEKSIIWKIKFCFDFASLSHSVFTYAQVKKEK